MLFSLNRLQVFRERSSAAKAEDNQFEECREKATKEAFGADRKVISRWRKRLRENGGNLTALIPDSTRLTIKSWQSDNDSQNPGEFDDELKREGIPHYFSYPRCPKINTYIERYNRTIQ